MKFGVVAIGRNEGERLRRCLESVSAAAVAVYVDSGSTDGSAQCARDHDVHAIELDLSIPFTAARARNAGFRLMMQIAPDLRYVQFVDGDCELEEMWLECAESFLDLHADVGVVCGRRRERHPEKSIYNWLCDQELEWPTGEVRSCGGVAMMRVSALKAVGGYRDDLIAGEEPELCVRLRAANWKAFQLDCPMTRHDAAITRFDQWWLRATRNGYTFAQGVYLHGAPPERHWVWESRRAWLWGVWLPLSCLASGLVFGRWGWFTWLIYLLQIGRQTVRNPGPLGHRALLALFQVLSHFAEGWGQIRFKFDRLLGRQSRLIEYK